MVTVAAAYLMRVDDDRVPPQYTAGDVVRAFLPPQTLIDTPRASQPRYCCLIVTGLNLTDAEFLSLQESIASMESDRQENPYQEGTPEHADWIEPPWAVTYERLWHLPWDPAEYADLPPPRRAFLDALVAELSAPPYGATREWKDLRQIAFKHKVSGLRFDETFF